MHITLEQLIEDELDFKCFVAEVDKKIIGFATFFFATIPGQARPSTWTISM